MDLGKFDLKRSANKGAKCYLKSPADGKTELPVFFNVLGRDSDTYRKFFKEAQMKLMNDKIAGKKIDEKSFEDSEIEDVEFLANLITGWGETEDGKDSATILIDEKKLKCDYNNIVKVLTQYTWIREQINAFIWNRANFLDN